MSVPQTRRGGKRWAYADRQTRSLVEEDPRLYQKKHLVTDLEETRNQELLCWRGPKAI
jgi:hypothetical protein